MNQETIDEDKIESMTQNSSTQGTTGPLLGDLGESQHHPSEEPEDKKTSEASGGESEECGRISRYKGNTKERAGEAQEKKVQGPTNGRKVLTPKPRGRKRKDLKETPGMKFEDIRQMFEDLKKEKSAKDT